MQFFCTLCNIQRVVGNSLKIGDRVQELGYLRVLFRGHFTFCDLDQIGTEFVLIPVNRAFQILDQFEPLVGIAVQQRNCLNKVTLGLLCHRIDGQTALFNGKRGVLNEAFFKPHCFRLDRFLLRLFAHQKIDGFFDLPRKRQKPNDLNKAEHRIDKCNGNTGHNAIRKWEPDQRIKRIINRCKQDYACDFGDQINHGRSFTVNRRADRRKKHRHGCADGNAHDDGERNGEINDAGRCKCL